MRNLGIGTALGFGLLTVPAMAQDQFLPGPGSTSQTIIVTGVRDGYQIDATSTATRTPTELNDVPQAVSIITETQIDDQAMRSIADVLRYVPGAVISQGEGHRDQIILRGNSSTADFFVDGLRDDVQYYRGLYNAERIEVLKGPNAMIFGRGGGGGVINRVTKRPVANAFITGSGSADTYGAWYVDADISQPLSESVSTRMNAVYEEFRNNRDFYDGRRVAINPTVALSLGGATRIDLGFEYNSDKRTIDRGVPSAVQGSLTSPSRPLTGVRDTFFGVPGFNVSDFEAKVLNGRVEHRFSDNLTLTSRILYGDYDKLYRNAFAVTPVTPRGGVRSVGLEAYSDPTTRTNLLNQNDLVWTVTTGPVRHVLLAGFEVSDQRTRNQRINGFFGGGDIVNGGRRVFVGLADPITVPPVTLRTAANTGYRSVRTNADVTAFYVQDQISIGDHVDVIGGVRRDRFTLNVDDLVAAQSYSRTDTLWSPRVGVVLKPVQPVSIYASYSRSFLPQSGDQFSSLDITSAALEPERFDNYELGLKWDILPTLNLTAAIYQLDRTNTRAADPNDAARTVLTGAQRSKGFELGLSGAITAQWQISAGYALQDATIRKTTSVAPAGREVPLVPKQQASLWTRYDLTPRLGAGVGVYHQSKSFTSISNTAILPAFTRVDAAAFFKLTPQIEAQINVENLLNSDYFSSAYNDNNIMPGAPTTVRATVRMRL
ncbi:TonB-dependent siderophore receptor [Qipengyuania citrea]|uniref:TonB-dependent siderophore receptor n=1 Tax=Qipengyuania citrea TaxID=225971 RepID=A0ABY4U4Q4_9SPHN|nr:TonB-dependent siderophore receptor [Qipengyuania citrea]USA61094.1 TonB-dependent siderophore receptor [Qipengyuania citrea]